MERIAKIQQHPLFLAEYQRLQTIEANREYCRHDLQHFLDVARACWIWALEEHLPLEKEVVYAAALLHDIGKGLQYEKGIAHDVASVDLAKVILPDCGFAESECELILEAIAAHRQKSDAASPLVRLLYDADKKTRLCFGCSANAECNWSEEKKNYDIII